MCTDIPDPLRLGLPQPCSFPVIPSAALTTGGGHSTPACHLALNAGKPQRNIHTHTRAQAIGINCSALSSTWMKRVPSPSWHPKQTLPRDSHRTPSPGHWLVAEPPLDLCPVERFSSLL